MSTDVLRRHLARFITQLRSLIDQRLPPLTCAISWPEGDPPEGKYRPRYHSSPTDEGDWSVLLADALHHPAVGCPDGYPISTTYGAFSGIRATAFFPEPVSPVDSFHRPPAEIPPNRAGTHEALQAARRVCRMLDALPGTLPDRLAQRLGLFRAASALEWVEALFHLGWHFPDHGIGAGRFRILSGRDDKSSDFPCSELDIQLGSVRVTPDVFPGVVLSRLGPNADFFQATLNALLLIEEAVEGVERGTAPQPGPAFGRLRDAFHNLGQQFAAHPEQLSVRILHLSDSFRTSPASEWAGISRGGDGWGVPRTFVLSRRGASRVVCFFRGPSLDAFVELADRAGALLPLWPLTPYPAVFAHPAAFARYCDPDRFPWAASAGDLWNRDMVTDHRGNVERWLGVAFALLMRERLSHFELLPSGDELTGAPSVGSERAALTRRGLNPFLAAARALELSNLTAGHSDRAVTTAQTPQSDASPHEPPSHGTATAEPRTAPVGVSGVEDVERSAGVVAPRSSAAEQSGLSRLRRLIDHAADRYAQSSHEFTLVGVPSGRLEAGWGFRHQPCQPGAAAAGSLRDGMFHWPLRYYSHLGSAGVEGVGTFVFVVEGADRGGVDDFTEFAGQAGAELLVASPPWVDLHRAVDAQPLWAATLLFLSPSASRLPTRHPTGPLLLGNPWAASIAALRDIASPAVEQAHPRRPEAAPRVECRDADRCVTLDGKRVVGEVELAVYRFFKAIADAYPDPVTYPTISARVPGVKGKHPTRDLKGRLPAPLDKWVESGKHGYSLRLPPPK